MRPFALDHVGILYIYKRILSMSEWLEQHY